jgi:hypothetical protein
MLKLAASSLFLHHCNLKHDVGGSPSIHEIVCTHLTDQEDWDYRVAFEVLKRNAARKTMMPANIMLV